MFLDPHNSSPQTGTINPLGVRSPVLGNWKKIYLGAIIFRSLDLKLFGHKRA
jgi:hypothetical protein